MQFIFTYSQKITMNAAEDFHIEHAFKAAGNFLLSFCHTQAPLDLLLSKGTLR